MDKKTPKVSIIVPVFQAEEFIDRCVESILKQDYHNIDIILINDGSTDKSSEICDEYARTYTNVKVIHQVNKGVSSARNAGIIASSGDYLMFVDSDDTIKSNAVSLLVNTALEYDAQMVSAVKSYVDLGNKESCKYDDGKISVFDGESSIRMSLEYERQTNSVCAKLFDRAFFSGIMFEEGRSINEDGYFLFECYALCPKVVQYNKSIYCYYFREKSSSRCDFSEKYFDMIYFSNKKKDYIYKYLPHLIDLANSMEISTHLFFLEVLCRTKDKKYNQQQKSSIEIVRHGFFSYHSHNSHERIMARIVTFGLYPLYKVILNYRKHRN